MSETEELRKALRWALDWIEWAGRPPVAGADDELDAWVTWTDARELVGAS